MSLFLGDIDKNILEASEAPDRTCLPTHAPRAFGALDALGLTPWHIAPLAFLCLALVLYKLAESLAFWRHVRRGSHVARVAAAALGELRSEQPTHHRRTRHSWFTASEGQTSVPLLCVACVGHIRPSSADTLQRCAVCGVVAHDGCVRHVGETCRPLATPPGPQQHFWLVSGTSMEEQGPIERISGAASCCIYCSEPVSGELHLGFATEPTWQCACCACYAHVQCFVKAHPHLEGVAGAAKADGEQREGMMKPPETIERLDTCSLGHLGRLVLPSSCVRSTKTKGSAAAKPQDRPSTPTSRPGSAANGAALHPIDALQGTSDTEDQPSSPPARQVQPPASAHRRSWWRRAFSSRPLQWQDWSIEALPPHCRPVLVLISARSGPQVGDALRRRFLRVLHPLQVVSLPRDAPEPALRLFAKVPGVRLLCVGGDGTVGWILSCLDKLADEVRQAAAGAGGLEGDDEGGSRYRWGVEWIPPPVAIMPLGTGNDLARCLGWGTGYSAWRQEGPVGALAEVAQATVALVDRWTLTFTRDALHSAPPTSPLASAGNALQLLSPRVLTSAGSLKLPDVSTKAMNNYFGIGVDAKVALEFHYMREHYPQWFQSQIGNRLVYTGMGALDIMGGGQLDLPFKLRLECDGLEVELPSGAEGVLIVNIPSYMGGVDLWASGNHTGGASAVHGAGSAGEYGAASGYRQSMCDGILELVAVYGSWHLGQLTVGLSGATQLRRARRVVVRTTEELPMQVDGEPFMQPAGEVVVELQSQSRMLRRVASKPVAKVLKAVEEALEAAAEGGVITAAQHNVVSQEVAMRLSS